MTNCKTCDAEIFFAWDKGRDRWVPIDVALLRGDEELHEQGVLLARHHMRHRCGFTPAPITETLAPHRALFVAADAPLEVVRAAFQALSRVYHPDHGGSVEAMRELTVAYEAMLSTATPLKER